MKKHILLLLILGTLSFSLNDLSAQCSFTVSNNTPCSSETVTFTVENPDSSTEYSWDFDEDGVIDWWGPTSDYSFPDLPVDSVYTVILLQDGDTCAMQDVSVFPIPDATIGVPPGITILSGNEIKACNGSSSFELEIYNASTTLSTNESYTINWGDGSPPEEYDNTTFTNSSTISHVYNGLGYFTILITVTNQNGCAYTDVYTFYNGGNPSVGLVIPGNTVGLCAPATLEFPITNTESNPPGTEYTVFINGVEVANFVQDSLLSVFTYTFEESSCGVTTSTGNYDNAFDIKIVASNPCNSSTATIEPIEVSEPPEPFFDISAPAFSCEGAIYGFENNTDGISEVVAGNPSECINVLNPNWTISGTNGTDWNVVSGNLFGSENIEIEFLTPGTYVITMTLVSFACGPVTFTQEITIYEPPEPGADINIPTAGGGGDGGCIPLTIPLDNASGGESLSYAWNISGPDMGWAFVDSTDENSVSPIIEFTQGGEYEIFLTVTNPCAEVNWDTTVLLSGPPALEMTPIPDYCQNANLSFDTSMVNILLNGSEINSYEWTFEGGTPSTSSDPLPTDIVYDTPGTYEVILTTTNDCGTNTVQDTFIVQEPSAIELPPDMELCSSEAPFQLDATPVGGSWSGPGVTPDGLFNPAEAFIGNNTITYTYGTGACFNLDNFNINIIEAATVNAGPDIVACSNDAAIILSGSPNNGTWTSPDGAVIDGNSFDPGASGEGTFTLQYAITDGNNCITSDELSAEVNTAPDVAVSDTSYCNTQGAVMLPAVSPTNGQWSGPGVSNGMFDPVAAGGPGSYSLTYTVQGMNGCNTAAPVEVGVIDPENVNAGPDVDLCINDEPLDLGDDVNPAGGSWTTSSQGLDGDLFDPQLAGGGTHTLTYMVGSGNCAVSDNVEILIADPGPVSAGPNESLCLDADPINLSGTSPAGGSWEGPGVTSTTFDPSVAAVGTHILTYTIIDGPTGCSKSAEREITVHPLPEAAFSIPDVICTESSFDLINESTGATSYSWDLGDGSNVQVGNPSHTYENTGTFTVELIVTNNQSCVDIAQRDIDVVASPEAIFDPGIDEDCGGLEVNVTNQSDGFETNFYWDFGNGMSSTMSDPDFPVNYDPGMNDTTYFITLTAQNICGSDTYLDSVLVKAFPLAEFGFTVDTGCAPLTVEFANITSGSPDSWFWDFGNGETSTDSIPGSQLFEGDTTIVEYPITLIAYNECGEDTLSQILTVEPEFVNAFFNTSNTLGCAPFTVEFTNYSTLGTNVSWDFGDGNVVSVEDPTHTFQEPGTYEIELYAANTCAEDSTTVEIEVLPSPEVSFSYGVNRCDDQPIQFTNTSENLAGSMWEFSTGDTSMLTNPIYAFPEPGNYSVTLTGISPANGCDASITQEISILEAPSAFFEPINAEGCAPLTVTFSNQSSGGDYFQWNFGDGNSSVQSDPVHTFTEAGGYDVHLSVTNPAGCIADTLLSAVFAYPVPTANFDIEKEEECGLPVNVTFTNLSEGAEGFEWNLGLPSGSSLVSPVQEYTNAGDYDISVIASNQYGCLDMIQQSMTLYETPFAEFALDSTAGCQPVTVSFANYSNGNKYLWDFGDGTTSEEEQPVHVYSEPGDYEITLSVSFDNVCYDSISLPGAVSVYPLPTASFNWVEEMINGGGTGTLEFINTSEQADFYEWDFGDGTYSDEEHPVHRYLENRAWQVLLTATTDRGCVDDSLAIIQPELIKGLYVPNAFAPDQGTGDARMFLPKGIGLKEYHVQIFSSYGQLIWQSTILRDGRPAEGWDGTHKGAELPQDVYVWKISAIFEDETLWNGSEYQKRKFQKIGSVTLIR